MGLKKYKLGELIELVDETNRDGQYGPDDVRGMTITKEVIPTKADVSSTDLSKFIVVQPKEFVFNPRTHGKKIGFGYNNTGSSFIISWNNIAFRVKQESKCAVLPEYLFLHFNREEWDREACFRSWGSSTEVFSWDALCEMKLTLPSIEQQRKYVDVYLSLQNNLAAYQSKVDDLKLVCDGYIEDLRKKVKCEKIGNYIQRYSEKNSEKNIDEVVGLSTEKKFRIAQSRVNRDELGGYKIVHPLDIAYVPTTDTWKVLAFAVNHYKKDVVVSPIYEVFSTTGKLKSDYLAIWMKRGEFDRYARYNSWGSARENFTFEEMQNVEIPIPDESIQQSIIDLYLVYEERKAIVAQLKEQLNNLCPILIKGSLQN